MGKLISFFALQNIPAAQGEVWDFISSPANLKDITPPYMGFNIISQNLPDKVYAGMIIQYKVSPVFGIPLNWVTEITQVDEPNYFIDEQRYGPYSFWHHQHFIKPITGGVEMKDIIHYKIPFGILGTIANELLVKKKLKEIFDFRRKKITEKFGALK